MLLKRLRSNNPLWSYVSFNFSIVATEPEITILDSEYNTTTCKNMRLLHLSDTIKMQHKAIFDWCWIYSFFFL